MAANRQHAHHLLDQLGPGQFDAVVHLLEIMVSPEEDGDTLSDAERGAVAEADEWLKHNQPIPHEEVLAEFGLTRPTFAELNGPPLCRSSKRWHATPRMARGTPGSFGISSRP